MLYLIEGFMRIVTIFAISITLALAILVSWFFTSIDHPTSQTHSHEQDTASASFKTVSDTISPENEAIARLQDNHFKSKNETARLVRLAVLHVVEDPKRALDYLSEAIQNDPKNPDLYTFQASLGESLNHDEMISANYILAIQHDPKNPYRREQLADFYLRSRQYKHALEILQDTMNAPSLDSIWLKTVFWNRLTIPLKESWEEQDIPEGNLKNLVSYMLSLPTGIYWNQQAFNKLRDREAYLSKRQETFWLQLLSALRTGQEDVALTLLNENIFHYTSWAPDLEKSLKTLLNYRLLQQESSHQTPSLLTPLDGYSETPQQLLQLLAKLSEVPNDQISSAIPYALKDYLLSQEAFTMPFLAVGWTEAAIQLHALERFQDTFPSWIAEATTVALNQNRGSKVALSFALTQKPSPSLSLLIAELALSANEKQIAFNVLKEIYTKNDESAPKAALILGQFLLENNNLSDAKKAILAQPALRNHTSARETLARIALQEGDVKKAYLLYLEVENHSSEAKSFLARKAFADREWKKARELTEDLLRTHPENPILKENLEKIALQEKRQITPHQ